MNNIKPITSNFTPNEEVILLIKTALEKAEKGELQFVAIAGISNNRHVHTCYLPEAFSNQSVFEQFGAIQHLCNRFYKERVECAPDADE